MSLIRGALQPGLSVVKKTAPFYSAVDDALANLKRPKGTGAEFFTELSKQAGVKKAELADRKLEQAFKAKGKMTKEEAQQVLKDNPPPNLKEKLYDESTAIDEEEIREMVSQEMYGRPYDEIYKTSEMRRILDEVYKRMDNNLGTKYGEYKTPDGENYREILLKLPEVFSNKEINRMLKLDADRRRGELSPEEMQELTALQDKKRSSPKPYYTGHWADDPNVLAHMRVQDRVGPNGEKILHVEEIQSDWHQAGRKKGYGPKLEEQYRAYYTTPDGQQVDIGFGKTPAEVERMTQAAGWNTMPVKIETEKTIRQVGKGVPDAPFKDTWHQLALKRALKYAADNGYERVGLTTGKQQSQRYNLGTQVDHISYEPTKKGFYINVMSKDGPNVLNGDYSAQELEGIVGKELTQKMLAKEGKNEFNPEIEPDLSEIRRLDGVDLQLEGKGMKKYYDEIYPAFLAKQAKKYGAQIGETRIKTGRGVPGGEPVRYIDIAPGMQDAVPYAKGGAVDKNTAFIKAHS